MTLLFTDVVDSTRAVVAAGDDEWRQTLNFLDDLVAARVSRAGGRIVKQTGDGHLIEFARPGDAVDAAIAICRAAPTLGVTLRAGIHTGEIERRENGDIGGLTVHIAARVAAVAERRPSRRLTDRCRSPRCHRVSSSETTANTNSKAYPADGHSSLSTLDATTQEFSTPRGPATAPRSVSGGRDRAPSKRDRKAPRRAPMSSDGVSRWIV